MLAHAKEKRSYGNADCSMVPRQPQDGCKGSAMKSIWGDKTLGIAALMAFGLLVLGLIMEAVQRVAPALLLVVVVLALAGCDSGTDQNGNHWPFDNESPEAAAVRKACYADAQAQLSPQWAGASRLERAVVAMQVINTCEGQP